VVEPRYVAMMNTMMQETLTIGTGRKAELPGWQAAGKTGTSQDFRDAWFVGYTSHLVTGVWLGNDDNSPTKKATGGGLPAEIWARFMKSAHRGVPVATLPGQTNGWGGLFSGFGNTAPPRPAPVSNRGVPAPADKPGMDNWLIDKLFGRR
jgi:penicillin-binding protein 1A